MPSETQISLDYVIKIVGIGFGVVLFLAGIIAAFVKMLHNDMKKSIESIHTDLKPLIMDVGQLKIEVINIKENHKELRDTVDEQGKWINHYDSRIQAIERHPALKN